MRSAAIRSGTTVTTPDNRERSEGQTCFTALLRARERWAPTREKADKLLDERLAAPFTADANDTLYQYAASGDYDPSPGLGRIQATVLAINSADDERNPPETGITDREVKRIKNDRLLFIPARRAGSRDPHRRVCKVLEAAGAGLVGDGLPSGELGRTYRGLRRRRRCRRVCFSSKR